MKFFNFIFFTMSFLILILLFFEYQKIQKSTVNAWTDNTQADCGVVLTGGPGRLREGFDLLVNKHIQKLIISGVHAQATIEDLFPLYSIYGDVNLDDIILERKSQTTFGNAQQSMTLIDALKCRDIILITSRLHMYRSLYVFEKSLSETVLIKSRAVIGSERDQSLVAILTETVKSLFYKLLTFLF